MKTGFSFTHEDLFKLHDRSDRYKYLSRVAVISSLQKTKNYIICTYILPKTEEFIVVQGKIT